MRSRTLVLALATALSAATAGVMACGTSDDRTGGRDDAETALDKADWLEKTARLLRNGEGLGPRDDVDALSALSKEAAVDRFMQDPRFGDMVVAFNLYYLGRGVDRVKVPNAGGGPGRGGFTYDRMVFTWPQALASAKAVVEGGNYFELFSADPPFLARQGILPFRPTLIRPPTDGGAAGDGGTPGPTPTLSDREATAAQLDAARAAVTTDTATGCSMFRLALARATNPLERRGYEPAQNLRVLWMQPSTPEFPNTVDCDTPSVPAEQLAASMLAVRNAVDANLAALDAKALPSTTIDSIVDIPALPSRFDGLPRLVQPLTFDGFWSGLPASSTNFQRKRASYVLKTYFCDDLTPLSVPATADAGSESDRHAQNPNCQACHYRLDPIGALFRNLGRFGEDNSRNKTISFNDGQTFTGDRREKYLDEWRNPDGSFRAGKYVIGPDGKPTRDTTWLDSDGDTLEGLWSYLPRSESVKACHVRRLAEFVLGPKQVYDREWLRQIARQAKLKNGPLSGAAFKSLVKTLVLSKTFSTQDPRAGVCYDAPADAPLSRPPCAVAHIVANQCADCHGSVQARGHIDLTAWSQLPDGSFSWPHEDEHGVPLPRAESLKRILDRITTADVEKRMPFQRALEGDDLNTLSTWLNDNLKPAPTTP